MQQKYWSGFWRSCTPWKSCVHRPGLSTIPIHDADLRCHSPYSKIKAIGLCHQIYFGYYMVGYLLSDYLNIDVPAFDFANARIGLEFNRMTDLIVKQTTPRLIFRPQD